MTPSKSNTVAKSFLSLTAGLLMAGNFLAACGDETSSKAQDDPAEEIEQDSTQSEQDTTSQQEEGDSLSQASFELKQLVAFDYYGFEHEWTEATLLEINPDLELSGKEFTAKAACDTCDFVFKNLKLATPYALIKIENKKPTGTPSLVFVDLNRADTVYANMLTLFESKRILHLMKEGLPTDSAEQKAHREIQTEILGKDIGLKPANQISRNEKDDSTRLYMAALTVGNMFHYKDVDQIFEKDGKWRDDSTKMVYTDWLAQNYMYLYNQESPKPERPIGTAIYGYLYGFGKCNSKNIDSVGVVANSFSKHDGFAFYCTEEYGWITDSHFADTYKWTEGYDGEIRTGEAHGMTYAYDSVQGKWIQPSIADSIPCITSNLGKVVRVVPEALDPFPSYYRICMDLGYQLFWNTATELQYYSQGLECDSTDNFQTSLVDSTVTLVCDNGEFRTPTAQDLSSNLLLREAELAPCGEEESFRKGVIDTTINYHCYRGELSYANEFDMAMGRGCNADNVGYYPYQNSIYNCNGFVWKYATDSLVTGSVTDERDGTIYKTVGIGNQIWIAQNMNYAIDSSWCPKDSAEFCEKYGRFYRWDAILGDNPQVENICPEGFHVPNNEEWDELANFSKTWFKNKTAIKIFASKNALEESDGLEKGDDLVGFSAYMIGSRSLKGSYTGWLYTALFCSQEPASDSTANVYMLRRDDSMNLAPYTQKQFLSCNARCLKD